MDYWNPAGGFPMGSCGKLLEQSMGTVGKGDIGSKNASSGRLKT